MAPKRGGGGQKNCPRVKTKNPNTFGGKKKKKGSQTGAFWPQKKLSLPFNYQLNKKKKPKKKKGAPF